MLEIFALVSKMDDQVESPIRMGISIRPILSFFQGKEVLAEKLVFWAGTPARAWVIKEVFWRSAYPALSIAGRYRRINSLSTSAARAYWKVLKQLSSSNSKRLTLAV